MSLADQEVVELSRRFEGRHPREVLEWAVERYYPNVGLTCSFGVDDVALAHMLVAIRQDVKVIFLNTSFHFRETLQFRNEFVARYGINLVEVEPLLTVEEQAERWGPELYRRDPDRCCAIRKVEPMRRALAGLDAWITGLRRDQASTRWNIGIVETHQIEDGRRIVKVNPLAGWTRQDVMAYLRENGVPYHPLVDRGYLSIGCWPCTRPVAPGEDERAGRWAGTGKIECGLHTFTRRAR